MYHYGNSFVVHIGRDVEKIEDELARLDKDINGSDWVGIIEIYQTFRDKLRPEDSKTTVAEVNKARTIMTALKDDFEALKRAVYDADEVLDMEFTDSEDKSEQYKWEGRYCDKLLTLEGQHAGKVMNQVSAMHDVLKHMEGYVVHEVEKDAKNKSKLAEIRKKPELSAYEVKGRFDWAKANAGTLFERLNDLRNSSYTVRVLLHGAGLGERPYKVAVDRATQGELMSLKG